MSKWLCRQLFAFVFAASLPLIAQEFRAGIAGIVKDAQGAVIPNAPIEAQNIATNDILHTTTNSAGEYAFPVLPIGTYKVTASPAGFKKAVRSDLELRVGDHIQQDFTVEVGAVSDSVTITAGAELLQTSGTDRGQVIGEENVRDLPSQDRNPFLLGVVATGVMFDIGAGPLSRAARPFDAGNNVGESMSINGGATGSSDLLLDGSPNTGTEGSSAANTGFVPTPETVSEFKMQSSNYDAQYGRTSGGTMTVSLKNGTNKLHGAVYWLNKNTILTANTFDQNRIGSPRAAYHQNNPGFELDGPVVIPHLYDGHNKTFFMYGYEIWRDSIPTPATLSVPQPAALQGNFNTTLQSNGQPITIYDPATTTPTGTNTYTRTAFPNNTIPANRLNPVGVKIASFIPAPNLAGQTSNLVVAPNSRTDAYDSHVARIDQVINEKERFFSRFVRGFRTENNGDYGFPHAAAPGNSYSDGRLNQGGNADLTSILSPSTVLTSRVGYFRHDLWITLFASGFDPTSLGFPASLLGVVPPYFPTIGVSGYTTFGASRSSGNQFTESATWSWSEIVNRTVRRHQLKFGAEFRSNLDNINSPTTNFGTYSFSAGWTQANALNSSAAAGNSIASLLLGMPASGSVPINPAYAYGNHYYGVFAQDDWRVTGRLTLSLGLRWDYESPLTERNNQANGPFDLNAASPIQVVDPLQPGLTEKGGITFTGSGNRLPYRRDLNNIQPRIGVAWQPMSKTVVRAGYGLSYFATYTSPIGSGFQISTPFVASPDGNISFSGNTLSNPYPQGILTPTGAKLGLSTFLGQSVTFIDPDRVIPHVHQFSVSIQRQLPSRSVIEVGFVGSRSQEMPVSQNLNAVTWAELAQYGANATPNLTDSVANPFSGRLPSTNLNGSTTTRQQLLLPFPQFTGVSETNLPNGQAWYNSLQVRWDKRFSHGLNVLVSYTRSKWLTATSYLNAQEGITATPDRTLNGTDTPNRIVLSGNWALPIFTHLRGAAGIFLHGWQVNGIFIRQNGFPLPAPGGYWSTGINPALPDSTEAKAFNTCTQLTSGVLQNCTLNGAALPVAFVQQYPNTARTLSGEFPTIRPPKAPNADLSIFKEVTIHERWHTQFRAEAFNATNSPQFGNPSTSLTSTSAGVVTLTQVNDSRNIQLSMRVRF